MSNRYRGDNRVGMSRKVRIWQPECLKCLKGFWADGRYNRICPRCTKANADLPKLAQHAVACCTPRAKDIDEEDER